MLSPRTGHGAKPPNDGVPSPPSGGTREELFQLLAASHGLTPDDVLADGAAGGDYQAAQRAALLHKRDDEVAERVARRMGEWALGQPHSQNPATRQRGGGRGVPGRHGVCALLCIGTSMDRGPRTARALCMHARFNTAGCACNVLQPPDGGAADRHLARRRRPHPIPCPYLHPAERPASHGRHSHPSQTHPHPPHTHPIHGHGIHPGQAWVNTPGTPMPTLTGRTTSSTSSSCGSARRGRGMAAATAG